MTGQELVEKLTELLIKELKVAAMLKGSYNCGFERKLDMEDGSTVTIGYVPPKES